MDYLGLLFVIVTIDQSANDKPKKDWRVSKGYQLDGRVIEPFIKACHQGIIDDYEAGVPCLVHTSTYPIGGLYSNETIRTLEIWAVPSKDKPRLVKAVREWCYLPNNIPFIGVWYRSLMEVLIMTSLIPKDNFADEFLDFLGDGEND